jgi:hypothetical protein
LEVILASRTFSSLRKEIKVNKKELLKIMDDSYDKIDFCVKMEKKYRIMLTMFDVNNIYETRPRS